jgi:hypothetical protein
MQIDLATLILDWFEEHYPDMCFIEVSKYVDSGMMLCLKDVQKGRSHYLGRITDTEFRPWIMRSADSSLFHAADPEFFEKIDNWLKASVFTASSIIPSLAEEWMTPSPPSLRDI